MIHYFDTSALIKVFIHEPGSDEVRAIFESSEKIGTSILTRVEMASALSKAEKLGWITAEHRIQAWLEFTEVWESIFRLSLTPVVVEAAANIAFAYGLRGYDATHLATTLSFKQQLETPIQLVSFDKELWKAGRTAGLMIAPDNIS